MKTASALVAAALVLTLGACDDTSPTTQPSVVPSPSGSASPTATATTPPVSPPTASPVAAPLAYRTKKTGERRGMTSISYELPVFTGAQSAEINRRVRRSVEDMVGGSDDPSMTSKATLEITGTVSVSDGRTVQVLLVSSYYPDGAAHPTDARSTVVLKAKDASPVLLTSVLSPLTPALSAALKAASEIAKGEGAEDPADSLKPQLKDWADWQSGPKGMTFYFDDYQAGSHAGGLREVAIPWSVLRKYTTTSAYALLGP